MAEKLLYLQNGVYKRKEITNGIMTYNNNSFTSVAPTKNGSFYIKLDDTGVSFEEKESALQTVNPSDLNYSHITTPHIIYVNNNNNFNTITLPSEQGNYMFVNAETPSFQKLTVSPSDMGINKTDTGSALMMITGDNSITTIPIRKNNWVNALFYNNTQKKWEASQITLFQQCGWQGDVTGFGIPIIKGDKSNTFITLDQNLSGDYLFAYSGNSTPTLKKIDTSLLGLKSEGILINNGQTFSTIKSKTAGNYYLKFGSNGVPSLEAVPASVAKISSKLVFTASSTPLTNELNTTDISCEGTNNFTTGKTFLITYEFDLHTDDIEGIIGGFKTVPILKIKYETTEIGEVCLGNPNNYIHVSGSSIITTTTAAINLTFILENDQVASYSFANNIKINLAEI